MKLPDFTSFGVVAALIVSIWIWWIKPLTNGQLAILLLNLEGTIMLAGSISFGIPPIGNGLREKLRWMFIDFPKYASPASFNPLRFYLGVLFILVSSILGALR